MSDRNRRLGLLFSALAIVGVLLLATSLDGLELRPGRPFTGRLTTAEEDESGPRPARVTLTDTLLLALGLCLALLVPLATLYLFLGADRRKRRLYVLLLLLGLLAFYMARQTNPKQEVLPTATAVAPEVAPEEEFVGPTGPIVDLEVRPPAWLAWLAAALLALLAAGSVLGIGWIVWVRAQQPPGPLPQLGEQAREALAELEAGADLRDVVMRCYLQMSRILEQERGLARDEAMTPREFEAALRNTGLPREPVARLTRLFEQVRYSPTRPGPREEEQALDSLSAIAAACRSTA